MMSTEKLTLDCSGESRVKTIRFCVDDRVYIVVRDGKAFDCYGKELTIGRAGALLLVWAEDFHEAQGKLAAPAVQHSAEGKERDAK